jgi:hypothetical protein
VWLEKKIQNHHDVISRVWVMQLSVRNLTVVMSSGGKGWGLSDHYEAKWRTQANSE